MTSRSNVLIFLSYNGDPNDFWEFLKKWKENAELNGIHFESGEITTITEEE